MMNNKTQFRRNTDANRKTCQMHHSSQSRNWSLSKWTSIRTLVWFVLELISWRGKTFFFMVDCKLYKNNRNSFFRIVNLDKNFDETAILNIIMDKNQKETDKYLKLIYSNDNIIRTNQRVNSCAQSTVFVYFKFSRRNIGQMGRLYFDWV